MEGTGIGKYAAIPAKIKPEVKKSISGVPIKTHNYTGSTIPLTMEKGFGEWGFIDEIYTIQ